MVEGEGARGMLFDLARRGYRVEGEAKERQRSEKKARKEKERQEREQAKNQARTDAPSAESEGSRRGKEKRSGQGEKNHTGKGKRKHRSTAEGQDDKDQEGGDPSPASNEWLAAPTVSSKTPLPRRLNLRGSSRDVRGLQNLDSGGIAVGLHADVQRRRDQAGPHTVSSVYEAVKAKANG